MMRDNSLVITHSFNLLLCLKMKEKLFLTHLMCNYPPVINSSPLTANQSALNLLPSDALRLLLLTVPISTASTALTPTPNQSPHSDTE